MGFLKTLVWAAALVGLGIFLATAEIGGRTPLEYMRRAWKHTVTPSKMDRLKGDIEDALEEAKDAVTSRNKGAPRERHSAEEREAVNRLIAGKGKG